jgi:flagellar protein FlaG
MGNAISTGNSSIVQQAQVLPAAPASSGVSIPSTAQAVPQTVRVNPKQAAPKTNFDPEKLRKTLDDIVDSINKQMSENKRALRFSVDDVLNTFVVTVRNSNSGEIIRQIPSETALRIAHRMEDMKGILFNKNS